MRFRIILKVDTGISRFGYPPAMRIEMEADSILEISAFANNDQFIVEVPHRSRSSEYVRSLSPSQVRRQVSGSRDFQPRNISI